MHFVSTIMISHLSESISLSGALSHTSVSYIQIDNVPGAFIPQSTHKCGLPIHIWTKQQWPINIFLSPQC